MFEQYIVRNLHTSDENVKSYKDPMLAYDELRRREEAGIDCEVCFSDGAPYDFYDTDPVPMDTLAHETGLEALSERLRGYSE